MAILRAWVDVCVSAGVYVNFYIDVDVNVNLTVFTKKKGAQSEYERPEVKNPVSASYL
jgi:hypothetical protein